MRRSGVPACTSWVSIRRYVFTGSTPITWRQTSIAAEVSHMRSPQRAANRKLPGALLVIAAAIAAPQRSFAYTPITPSLSGQTVTLTGHDLSIDQIVMVARHGAKVELSQEARDHEANSYGLLIEASAEGIPVYWFNRGVGQQRETVLFQGDAMADKNRALISK